uniref:Uncharacterized protein n=1 Tax=Arundo donax TaxID=35708 RepID=A0A0A8ZGI2_ARUDO
MPDRFVTLFSGLQAYSM